MKTLEQKNISVDVRGLKQVQLYLGGYISHVADYGEVEEVLADIIQEVDVMNTGLYQIIRMYHACCSAEHIQLIAKVIHRLCRAVSEVRSFFGASSPHLVAPAPCQFADLDRLDVNDKAVLAAINGLAMRLRIFSHSPAVNLRRSLN